MAKLIPPEICFCFIYGRKKSKYHLIKAHGNSAGLLSVCKFIVPEQSNDECELKKVSEVKANDICQKCLGAMKVKD